MTDVSLPFNRHLLWSSLDADAKADLLLQDISDLFTELREAQWTLQLNSNGVSSLQQSLAQLDARMNALSDRVSALGK